MSVHWSVGWSVGRLVGWLVGWSVPFLLFFGVFELFEPTALVTFSSIAPSHPHETRLAEYPALIGIKSSVRHLKKFLIRSFSCDTKTSKKALFCLEAFVSQWR